MNSNYTINETESLVRNLEIGKTFYMVKSNRNGILMSEWYRSKADAFAANKNNAGTVYPIAKHFRKQDKIAEIESLIAKRESK